MAQLDAAMTGYPLRLLFAFARRQQMLKCRQKLGSVRRISREQGLANIIDNHLLDFCGPLFLMQQILTQRCRSSFRNMFMFGNGRDLRTGQSTKCDAVFH